MNVKYYGWRSKDDLGNPLKRAHPPCAVVSFTRKEEALAIARIEYTNYRFDLFGDESKGCAYVGVTDRDDYGDFMKAWKDAKKRIKKEDLK